MQQVIVVHGGTAFETRDAFIAYLHTRPVDKTTFMNRRDWKANLAVELGNNFEVLSPQMPNKTSACYEEWKIWFKRMLPFVEAKAIFIGHSLGAAFLAKYLLEAQFQQPLRALLLVAPPFEGVLDFTPHALSAAKNNIKATMIYHSEDDTVVPLADVKPYQELFPQATLRTFSDRGHFNGELFPEIVADIRRLSQEL
jgi:uncharacterized protein